MIQTVKLSGSGYIVNGNTYVPDDPSNRHYKKVQEWLSKGNAPEPADPPEKPDPIEALISQEIRQIAIDSLTAKGKLTTDGKIKEGI